MFDPIRGVDPKNYFDGFVLRRQKTGIYLLPNNKSLNLLEAGRFCKQMGFQQKSSYGKCTDKKFTLVQLNLDLLYLLNYC